MIEVKAKIKQKSVLFILNTQKWRFWIKSSLSSIGIAPCKWSTNWDNFVPRIVGSAMAGKREKPEEIVSKLREVEVLQGQGMTIADAVRQIGVTQQTFY